ncbi:hypothetical protein LIER_29719 [Lithospermum erythrorhizon]|uniref:Uncharacterized protein n=1 Tax=Lithospermum erythrorhizon TaxID=34254 RepID=A0AAV3RK33_LITER
MDHESIEEKVESSKGGSSKKGSKVLKQNSNQGRKNQVNAGNRPYTEITRRNGKDEFGLFGSLMWWMCNVLVYPDYKMMCHVERKFYKSKARFTWARDGIMVYEQDEIKKVAVEFYKELFIEPNADTLVKNSKIKQAITSIIEENDQTGLVANVIDAEIEVIVMAL